MFRALGQGAFGEVYQGYFKKHNGEEVPVAVKTLPELSTNQGNKAVGNSRMFYEEKAI